MKLSAEQFAELAATFHPQSAPAQQERRRAARTELVASVKITPVAGGKYLDSITVTICDFSARGVAFIDAKPLERGLQFVLELPRRSGGAVAMLCTVTHVKSVGPQMSRMGAEFTCILEPSQHHRGISSSAADPSVLAQAQRIRETIVG